MGPIFVHAIRPFLADFYKDGGKGEEKGEEELERAEVAWLELFAGIAR